MKTNLNQSMDKAYLKEYLSQEDLRQRNLVLPNLIRVFKLLRIVLFRNSLILIEKPAENIG